jgi:hypothetical protein
MGFHKGQVMPVMARLQREPGPAEAAPLIRAALALLTPGPV